jgi:hypothetical protein
VQTLLSTKLLSRVIGEIAKKEERNFPGAAADPATPSAKYLAALDGARQILDKRADASRPASLADRRRNLLIEFVADTDGVAVLVGTFRSASDDAEALEPVDREVFSTLELPRDYVLREIRLILSDSFKVAEDEVDRLGPLGPARKSSAGNTAGSADTPGAGPAH